MTVGTLFRPGVGALLGLMAFVQVRTALLETQTWDEGFDLAAGYSYLKTGDFRINREHPPLGKFINALPLLFLNPSLPLDNPAWANEDSPVFGDYFLYRNRVSPDTLLFAGRSMTILTTLLAGLFLAVWMRGQFGPAAALIALVFYTFDPNLIAHGRYVTSDLFVTVFFFFAALAWGAYLERPKFRSLIVAGVLTGLALTSKVSAVLLLPAFVLLYLIRWWQRPSEFGVVHMVKSVAGLLLIMSGVIVLVYAPEANRLIPATTAYRQAHPEVKRIHEVITQGTITGSVLEFAGTRLGVQNHSFLVAVNMVSIHNLYGHPSYLNGQLSQMGRWYYFPVAFAVKTPVAVLLALLAALGVGLWRIVPVSSLWGRLRDTGFVWYTLAVPPLLYFGVAMAGNINLGLRHILVIYPFLYALLGAFLACIGGRPGKALALAILLLTAAESLSIHPHYLAFFNFFSGGPVNGPKYLVDSNIDWGQDIQKLNGWLKTQGTRKVWLLYFGRDDLWRYGLELYEVPRPWEEQKWLDLDGYVAVSATVLQGVYVPLEQLERLRNRKPAARIGYSIYVYDFHKSASPNVSTSPTK